MRQKVFVVTGSNKGIGYGIVRGLAEKVSGAVIYLTARNPKLGEGALSKVHEELGSKRQSEIQLHQLDITDENSCKTFAAHLKKAHDGIDVLINNAGFAYKTDVKPYRKDIPYDPEYAAKSMVQKAQENYGHPIQIKATESEVEQAEVTIGINYYGTKTVSRHLVPLIRPGGRIVNVCSQAGIMTRMYSPDRINKFKDGNYTEADIDRFVEEYKKATREDNRRERGFPESAYRVSKAAEIAYTLLQNAELESKSVIANACCPGFVDTDMSNHKGHLTIAQGADTPIYLAIDPNAPSGQFVYLRKITQWL